MATQAQKDAAKKKREAAKRKKVAAQRVIDDPNASASKKAAARQRREKWGSAMQIQSGVMQQTTQAPVTQADIGDTSSAAYTGAQSNYDALEADRLKALGRMRAARLILSSGKMPDGSTANAAQLAAAQQRSEAKQQTALNVAGQMRSQDDIMRQITGRQKGQGTRYIGPTGGALDYNDPRAVAARQLRGLDDPTDWQRANLGWMAEQEGATTAARRRAFTEQWGDPGSDEYAAMQELQKQRMAAGVTDPDVVPTVTGPVRGPGIVDPGLLGPFSPGGRMPAGYGAGPYGGGPYGGGAAQDAAQGWAGQMGCNIDPRGGLLLRPWEAQSWQLAGIDPNLWNPQSGLLGGPSQYTQPGGRPPVDWTTLPPILPEPGTQPGTTTTPTNPFAVDPNKWTPPHGFVVDPIKEAGGQSPFMQWTIAQHAKNQAANAANWANPDALVANRPGAPIGPSQTYVSPPGPHRNLPAVTTAQVPLTVGSTTDPVSGRQTHGFDPTTGQVFNQGWRNWMDTNPLQGYVQGMDRVGDISAATSEGLLVTDIWT